MINYKMKKIWKTKSGVPLVVPMTQVASIKTKYNNIAFSQIPSYKKHAIKPKDYGMEPTEIRKKVRQQKVFEIADGDNERFIIAPYVWKQDSADSNYEHITIMFKNLADFCEEGGYEQISLPNMIHFATDMHPADLRYAEKYYFGDIKTKVDVYLLDYSLSPDEVLI